jgi:hypothetical protein
VHFLRSPLPVIHLLPSPPKIVTVCPAGCNFTTIAGAVNAAPQMMSFMHAGTYTEPATNIAIPLTIMYRPPVLLSPPKERPPFIHFFPPPIFCSTSAGRQAATST